jgi:hypothetical protein
VRKDEELEPMATAPGGGGGGGVNGGREGEVEVVAVLVVVVVVVVVQEDDDDERKGGYCVCVMPADGAPFAKGCCRTGSSSALQRSSLISINFVSHADQGSGLAQLAAALDSGRMKCLGNERRERFWLAGFQERAANYGNFCACTSKLPARLACEVELRLR